MGRSPVFFRIEPYQYRNIDILLGFRKEKAVGNFSEIAICNPISMNSFPGPKGNFS